MHTSGKVQVVGLHAGGMPARLLQAFVPVVWLTEVPRARGGFIDRFSDNYSSAISSNLATATTHRIALLTFNRRMDRHISAAASLPL